MTIELQLRRYDERSGQYYWETISAWDIADLAIARRAERVARIFARGVCDVRLYCDKCPG